MELGTIHWLNRRLGWRIEHTAYGFALFNAWGYVGTYRTIREAISRHDHM